MSQLCDALKLMCSQKAQQKYNRTLGPRRELCPEHGYFANSSQVQPAVPGIVYLGLTEAGRSFLQ